MSHYSAPWDKSLIIISGLATAICLVVSAASLDTLTRNQSLTSSFGLPPLVIIAVAALFCIRRYTLTANAVLVQRLFWQTRLPLAGLQSVDILPDAMRGSIRTWGNGGLFSFSGRFWNRTLGNYRAWVTDREQTVVLRFADRTLVLSPDAPEDFVRALRRQAGLAIST